MKPSKIALKDALYYDPLTGVFTWIVTRNGGAKIGKRAGCIDHQGYVAIKQYGKNYSGHRLAWFLHYGEWPQGHIDHANCDRADNRITNLRIATPTQNNANQKKRPRLLPNGVCRLHSGRFQAAIKYEGKNSYLGVFDTVAEAESAYAAAAKKAFGEYARLA